MSIKGFINECNKRDVFKLLSIYIVSSWVLLQVISLIAEPLNLPKNTLTYSIIVLLFGFPIYIFILWKTKVRHAKTDTIEDSVESSIKSEIGFKRIYFTGLALIGFACMTASALIINNSFFGDLKLPNIKSSDKLAVLNFQNNTGDETLDIVGKMTADWLIHGITENHAGEVISSDVVNSYSSLLGVQVSPQDNLNVLNKFLNPNKVISGAYFKTDNTLVIRCSIGDGSGDNIEFAFPPIECDVNNSLDCIEELRQRVVGYLINKELGELSLEDYPPKFEAYEKLFDAQAVYADSDMYIKLLNESIAIDSNYFEPQVLRVQHYYNEGDYKISGFS